MLPANADAPPGPDEALLRILFGVVDSYPAIFKPDSLSHERKQALLTVIEAGYSIHTLKAAYVDMVCPDPNDEWRTAITTRNTGYIRSLASIIQCSLGMPEHKDVVMGYLLENLSEYATISIGFLGGRGMYGKVSESQRASCPFNDLLKAGPDLMVANLCRDEAGEVLGVDVLDQILITETDAHGFLMSVIANGDRQAIEQLLRSGLFLRRISREDALRLVGDSIQNFPAWNLEEALGPLLTVRNHETVIIEVKRLIDAQNTSVEVFSGLLWAGMSKLAIAHLVAYAINEKGNAYSTRNFLQACSLAGHDLYLGCIEARSGLGAVLDALEAEVSEEGRQNCLLESYLWHTSGDLNTHKLAPILLQIPRDMLAVHASASDLLYELYRLSGDKSLLALGGQRLRARVLEDEIGL